MDNTSKKPRIVPKVVKETKASFFGDKGHISSREAKRRLKKDDGKVSGFGGRYTRKQIEEIAKEKFTYKKVGHVVDRKDVERIVGDEKKARSRAKTYKEKREIDKTISFIRKKFGK